MPVMLPCQHFVVLPFCPSLLPAAVCVGGGRVPSRGYGEGQPGGEQPISWDRLCPRVPGAAARTCRELLLRSRPSGEVESVRPRCRLLLAASHGRNACARVASPLPAKPARRGSMRLWASWHLQPSPRWVPPPPPSIFPKYFITAQLFLMFLLTKLTNQYLINFNFAFAKKVLRALY